jgi:hypothetical protein
MKKTVGQVVADRIKEQYFDRKGGKWATTEPWTLQPEQLYIVLQEVKSVEAIKALGVDGSWLRRLPKEVA